MKTTEEGLWNFKWGDKVFLKMTHWKDIIRFRIKGKLAPGYMSPFQIMKRIRPVAY
jgi:hypothetical protein